MSPTPHGNALSPTAPLYSARDCAELLELVSTNDAPVLYRMIQRWRPYTCPFEVLISFVRDGVRVLDIGCGSGLFLGLLAMSRKNISGIGVDVSPAAVEAARSLAGRIAAQGKTAHLEFRVSSDVRGWPEGEFDVVSMIDVLHHVPPAQQVPMLEHAASRVRPGGILLYKDMCLRPLWRRAANRLHDLVLARQWVHELDPKSVDAVAQRCGLKSFHSTRLNRWWYGHDLRIFARL